MALRRDIRFRDFREIELVSTISQEEADPNKVGKQQKENKEGREQVAASDSMVWSQVSQFDQISSTLVRNKPESMDSTLSPSTQDSLQFFTPNQGGMEEDLPVMKAVGDSSKRSTDSSKRSTDASGLSSSARHESTDGTSEKEDTLKHHPRAD